MTYFVINSDAICDGWIDNNDGLRTEKFSKRDHRVTQFLNPNPQIMGFQYKPTIPHSQIQKLFQFLSV